MPSKKPKVLVLGAHGFVGRYVCREFNSKGYEVYGYGHGDWDSNHQHNWGVTDWQFGNISEDKLHHILKYNKFESIINCAGSGSVSNSFDSPEKDFDASVLVPKILLESLRINSFCGRLVQISSAAVYGDAKEWSLKESDTNIPVSPYGYHKLIAEKLCESYSRYFGIKVSIVRLFSVYGDELRKQLIWDALIKLHNGQNNFFGTGNEVRDWIHVQDASSLLFLAATVSNQDSFEIYNGGNQHAIINDVLTMLFLEAGHKEIPVFNGETHIGNPHRLVACTTKSREKLGWEPIVALQEGIKRYVHWFRQEGRL